MVSTVSHTAAGVRKGRANYVQVAMTWDSMYARLPSDNRRAGPKLENSPKKRSNKPSIAKAKQTVSAPKKTRGASQKTIWHSQEVDIPWEKPVQPLLVDAPAPATNPWCINRPDGVPLFTKLEDIKSAPIPLEARGTLNDKAGTFARPSPPRNRAAPSTQLRPASSATVPDAKAGRFSLDGVTPENIRATRAEWIEVRKKGKGVKTEGA